MLLFVAQDQRECQPYRIMGPVYLTMSLCLLNASDCATRQCLLLGNGGGRSLYGTSRGGFLLPPLLHSLSERGCLPVQHKAHGRSTPFKPSTWVSGAVCCRAGGRGCQYAGPGGRLCDAADAVLCERRGTHLSKVLHMGRPTTLKSFIVAPITMCLAQVVGAVTSQDLAGGFVVPPLLRFVSAEDAYLSNAPRRAPHVLQCRRPSLLEHRGRQRPLSGAPS